MQAKEAYSKAERDYARVENLYKDSVVTLEQLQNTRTALEVAKSKLSIAEFNLNHSTIIAPSKGKILRKFSEEGEITGPGAPQFLFGENNNGWVIKIGVTDRDVIKLSPGDKAEIYVDAHGEASFNAAVSEIGVSANPYNGTFEVELTLEQSNEKLVSGFIAKAIIYPSSKSLLYTIPVEALFEANGKAGIVFTYNSGSGSAESTNIIIEEILPGKIAVKSGLEGKTFVITDGVEYLTAGRQVVIK
jgi:RND family efflux transporter MFP subunit